MNINGESIYIIFKTQTNNNGRYFYFCIIITTWDISFSIFSFFTFFLLCVLRLDTFFFSCFCWILNEVCLNEMRNVYGKNHWTKTRHKRILKAIRFNSFTFNEKKSLEKIRLKLNELTHLCLVLCFLFLFHFVCSSNKMEWRTRREKIVE